MKNVSCFCWLFTLLLIVSSGWVGADELTREQQIKSEMQTIIAQLDSKERGSSLPDREFAVALFQQVMDRNPSYSELTNVESLLLGDRCQVTCLVKIPRSHLLAVLLAKKEGVSTLSYENVQANMSTIRSLDLDTVPFWQPEILKDENPFWEPRVDRQEDMKSLSFEVQENRGEYQVYHGYFHAHTSFSDGSGTPDEAYTMVRDQANMDFFAVTDHSEMLLLWPWENKWEELKATADKYHADNKFVTLYGFEWSSPIYGHINVLNTPDLTNCIDKIEVKDICKWIAKRPEIISRFNHPGRDKFGVEFDHFKLQPNNIKQMVALEMFSKKTGIQSFLSKGYFGKTHFLNEANQKGWKLGVVGGQDNHDKNWGTRNDFNVGVWATELTRQGIVEAYRARRTFATEDRNLSLSFQIDGAQMGSLLRSGNVNLEVKLNDGDRENFVKVDIYKADKLIHSHQVKSKNPNINHQVETQAGDFYYVVATQEDGDIALSSPIWVVE